MQPVFHTSLIQTDFTVCRINRSRRLHHPESAAQQAKQLIEAAGWHLGQIVRRTQACHDAAPSVKGRLDQLLIVERVRQSRRAPDVLRGHQEAWKCRRCGFSKAWGQALAAVTAGPSQWLALARFPT
jgi:hypothetical protein